MARGHESNLNAIKAMVTFGDEQYAEGVQDGWQQAINTLTDLICAHKDWTPNQLLARLYIEKDDKK